MMLDFVKFINENAEYLSKDQKSSWIDDFAEARGWQKMVSDPITGKPIENPISSKDFVNKMITEWIFSDVNKFRFDQEVKKIKFDKIEVE